ncbi:GLPGLI family protein [Chryseobacterium arthrosphaerae]|uniref:GLPGLI family protein n=1 Tax=Chryseobacterium arthrosphaerae TaxID=651561 RepID=A0A3S0Q436_9FLAO|nr:GLPGLI family protein [Chryseobacterium arthrosphaerae]
MNVLFCEYSITEKRFRIPSTSNKNFGKWSKTVKLERSIHPKNKFSFTIIQSNENIQYFNLVGMSILTYKEPIIKDWKLSSDTKIINTINCKKAEVTFKGRNWIAWYSPEIPLPYGPYKFSGLPGLIVKITDDKEEYDFELVNSINASKLKGKLIKINENRYNKAIETTQAKFEKALKDANANLIGILQSSETTIIKGQEMIRQRQKEREEIENMKTR